MRTGLRPRSEHRLSTAARLWVSALIAFFLQGCAGYHLGPTNEARSGEQSVQVNPFVNQTIEPRLSDAIASSMRKHLQKDGTYRLETKNQGDIILSGAILNYERVQLSFQPTDVLTPNQYRIVITAQVTAKARSTGKMVMNRKISGQSTVFVGADLPSSERQVLPLVADDLAQKAIAYLADGEW